MFRVWSQYGLSMVSENLGEFRTVLTTWPCIACSSCTSVGSLNIWVARSIYVVDVVEISLSSGRAVIFVRLTAAFPRPTVELSGNSTAIYTLVVREDESDYVIVAQPGSELTRTPSW
jgi:hypothetical protein